MSQKNCKNCAFYDAYRSGSQGPIGFCDNPKVGDYLMPTEACAAPLSLGCAFAPPPTFYCSEHELIFEEQLEEVVDA